MDGKIQHRSRLNRGNATVILFLIIVIYLLYRGGVFQPAYWQDAGAKFQLNFIQDQRYLMLLKGLWATVQMSIMACALGIVIGIILSVIRVAYKGGAKIRFFNFLASAYIAVIRGTPVMVQILIWHFTIFGSLKHSNKLLIAALAFGLNSGAYIAEIFRSGIESLDVGQMEAGRSLGLGYAQTMRLIILPQAFKNTLPALFNELITLLKETSVAGYIAVNDLTRAGQNIQAITYDSSQPLLMVAVIYLVIVLGLTRLLTALERKLGKSDRR